jgi:hypothetical protein
MTAAMQNAGLAGLLALTADSNPCFRREKAISFQAHHSPRHAQAHRSRWRGNLLPASYMYPVIRGKLHRTISIWSYGIIPDGAHKSDPLCRPGSAFVRLTRHPPALS